MTAAPPSDPALDVLIRVGQSRNRDELFFTMVNRTVALVPYDRASLWTLQRRPRVLAVSGNEPVDPRSSFAVSWSAALAALKNGREAGPLSEERFKKGNAWNKLVSVTDGLSALWLPIPDRGVGVLFERWGTDVFGPTDSARLEQVVKAYGLMWKPGRSRHAGGIMRWLFWLVFLAALACALALVRVPLRVVAECEVTARNPRLISSPMDGVIDEVLVSPGQRVKTGEPIAVYDSRLMEEKLKISRRQVEVVEAELASARARGFSDARYRGETAILEARLEQENVRLEALEVRFSRRLIAAPVDGMVQLDDARAWRGKPVSTGQAVLWLVDLLDTRVTLWLPQDDRIEFDLSRPIFVHLHALGGEAREARVTYMSSFAQAIPDGRYAFLAEAEWLGTEQSPPLGLRGSTSIYGEEASLGYWLFRRPLAWARRWLGV